MTIFTLFLSELSQFHIPFFDFRLQYRRLKVILKDDANVPASAHGLLYR